MHLQFHRSGRGIQRPLIAPSLQVAAAFGSFVAASAKELVGLRVQHRVQDFFNGAANHLAEMIFDPRFVHLDHLTHRFELLTLFQSMLLSASLKGAVVTVKSAKDCVRYPTRLWTVVPSCPLTDPVADSFPVSFVTWPGLSKTTLLTGSAGFIGFHFAQTLLAFGFRVHGFDGMIDFCDVTLKQRRHQILLQTSGFSAAEAMLEDDAALRACADDIQLDIITYLAAQRRVCYISPMSAICCTASGLTSAFMG